MFNILKLHSGDETGQGKVRTKMIRGAGMDFQRGMWAEAWVQIMIALRIVVLVVFGELAVQLSIEWFEVPRSVVFITAGTFASTLLWAYLAYAIHAQILLPLDRSSFTDGAQVFGFALRSLSIATIVSLATILVTFVLAILIGGMVFIYPFLAFLVIGFPLFVWLGTILPAYVADRARGVDAAIERGKAQFGWIAGRLLVGPILLFVLSMSLYLLLPLPTDGSNLFWSSGWDFQPVAVLGYLLFNMVQAFVTVLTAVILSRAFIRAEGMPDAAAV